MFRKSNKSVLAAAAATATVALTGVAAQAAPAGWDAYLIRGLPTINENYGGNPEAVQFIVNGGGAKAGLGTNSLNGSTIGDVTQLAIDRDDTYTRFLPTEGAYYAPFMNFWVQDATGKVAVLANEPSNAEWGGTSEWNTTGANLATKTVKVFEIESGFQLPAGASVDTSNGITTIGANFATFGDFAGYEITSPSAAYLALNEPVGSGAPRELVTNASYGFNWVFGDTGSNYVSDATGFIVSDPVAVPEPTGLGLLALGGVMLLGRRRARRAAKTA